MSTVDGRRAPADGAPIAPAAACETPLPALRARVPRATRIAVVGLGAAGC